MKIIRVLLVVYLIMFFAVYFLQAKLVFVPTVGEPENTPADLGLKYENLMLKSGSESIHAWYVPAPENRATVLFCHGNAGNLGHRLSTIRIWHELGINIMLFDYRGFGKSTGSPSEVGCYEDARACYDWLKENNKLSEPFLTHGRSLGGGVASWAASELNADALVLESTFTSIPDMGAEIYPFLPIELISRIKFPTQERLKSWKKPLIFFHSPNDKVIPFKMAKKMSEENDAVLVDLDGDHNSGFTVTPNYIPELDKFIENISSNSQEP